MFSSKVINWRIKVPERLKRGVFEKWGNYWKGVYIDYRDVGIDVVKGCKERPFRALLYTSGLITINYLYKNNPDDCSFRVELLNNSNKLMFVSEQSRNPISSKHIELLTNCYNENIIRHLNLGIISFIWLDNYSDNCKQYKTVCNYLKPSYIDFYKRIIDIGFLGKWWIINDKMKDYDINPEEFLTI